MESFSASESNLARTQTGGLGKAEGTAQADCPGCRPQAAVPRRGPLCLETLGPVGKGTGRVLFIYYCHFNHLEVQLSINH